MTQARHWSLGEPETFLGSLTRLSDLEDSHKPRVSSYFSLWGVRRYRPCTSPGSPGTDELKNHLTLCAVVASGGVWESRLCSERIKVGKKDGEQYLGCF
jgi:hypothetical protein